MNDEEDIRMRFKKIKRFMAAGLVALMTAGLLAGCGKDGSETEKKESDVTERAEPYSGN